MTDRPIRIGVLGAARITPKAIIQPAQNMPNVEVIAIAARDPKRAQAFADQHGIRAVYSHYEALIQADDIDLVYNALPISEHAPWTIKAAQAGKHVLCEKPFALNIAQAQAMQAESAAHGVRIIEAFHHRYHPAFIEFLSLLESQQIGPIAHIKAEFNAHIPNINGEIRHQLALGGGAMFDLGCYPLAWVLSVMGGPPIAIDAHASLTPTGVDETLTARLDFADNIAADIRTSMAAGEARRSFIEVTGEDGQVIFNNPVYPPNGGALDLKLTRQRTSYTYPIDPTPTYDHQLRAVISALNSAAPLPTEGVAILTQQACLDAIYTAAGLPKG